MQEMRNDCCWCGKDTSQGPVVTLSATFNEKGRFFEKEEGYIKELSLTVGKEVWTIITGKNSPAKREDKDMLFMCCSRECALELKQALDADKEFLDSINFM